MNSEYLSQAAILVLHVNNGRQIFKKHLKGQSDWKVFFITKVRLWFPQILVGQNLQQGQTVCLLGSILHCGLTHNLLLSETCVFEQNKNNNNNRGGSDDNIMTRAHVLFPISICSCPVSHHHSFMALTKWKCCSNWSDGMGSEKHVFIVDFLTFHHLFFTVLRRPWRGASAALGEAHTSCFLSWCSKSVLLLVKYRQKPI